MLLRITALRTESMRQSPLKDLSERGEDYELGHETRICKRGGSLPFLARRLLELPPRLPQSSNDNAAKLRRSQHPNCDLFYLCSLLSVHSVPQSEASVALTSELQSPLEVA